MKPEGKGKGERGRMKEGGEQPFRNPSPNNVVLRIYAAFSKVHCTHVSCSSHACSVQGVKLLAVR